MGGCGRGCRGGGRARRLGQDPRAALRPDSPRTWAHAELTGVGAGGGRAARGEAAYHPSIGKSPLYKNGRRGRSSDLKIGRQRKVVLGRVLGTVPSGAGWVPRKHSPKNWGAAWAPGQCRRDTLIPDSCRESPTNPPSLLQERGRDSLGSLPILICLDSGWKQGTGRVSDNYIFREQLEVQ